MKSYKLVDNVDKLVYNYFFALKWTNWDVDNFGG